MDNDNSNLVDDCSNLHSVADDDSVVRLDPHIILFQNEDSLRNSDFLNRETSTTSPFEWVQVPPPYSSQIDTVNDAGTGDRQDDVRFPRSFFSFFKDKSNFPLSAASQYCVDKFSALQGYLSINPQFDVEIFHNAGINKCCERPPPSVNSCLQRKRETADKEFLYSLPKLNFNQKVQAWLSGSYRETAFAELNTNKEDSCSSILSLYYQSDFLNSFVFENDIPHLHLDEFLKLFSSFLFSSWVSFLAGGHLVFFLFLLTFLMFLGPKCPLFFFQLLTLIGGLLDIFFKYAESVFSPFFVFFSGSCRPPMVTHLIRRVRLKLHRFLARFSSFFLPGRSFKPGTLFLPKLRHIPAFVSSAGPLKSRFHRYQARRMSRGKKPLLQLHHLKNNNNKLTNEMLTVPLLVHNNVPSIKADIGKVGLSLIIDSGSPCNLIPYSLLKEFENSSGFRCPRFANQTKLQAHNSGSLNIRDSGAIIPVTFIDCTGSSRVLHLPFLLENCTGKDVIIGLPQIKCLDVNMESNDSTCTLTLKNSHSRIEPTSPIPVYSYDDTLVIPNDIQIKNGLYHLSNDRSMHEPNCNVEHDPRIECNLTDLSFVKRYLPPFAKPAVGHTIHNSLDEQVFVNSNRCEKRLEAFGTMLPELVGVLEFIDGSQKQFERKSRPGFSSRLSNSSVPRVSKICDAPHTDHDIPQNDSFIDLDFIENESDPQDEPYSSQSLFKPEIIIHNISSLPALSNVSRLHFVTEGPNYSCLLSNSRACSCICLKHKDIIRFESFSVKGPKLMVTIKNNIKLIYFSLPFFVRVCDTQKIALLSRLLHKFGTPNIVWDITGHGSHPSLPEFINDLKTGFSRVLVPSQIIFNLYILDETAVNPPPPPLQNKVQNIFVEKNIGMRGNDSVIPESVLNEAEAFPFLPVLTLEEDTETFLSHSGPEEKDFLRDLLKTYSSVPSAHPGDIGKVVDKGFLMDIVLKDPSHPLPLDMPFPSSVNKKLACSKIVKHWMDAGIVVPSSIRTHASRLTVAHKHLNKNDFNKIINRLKEDHNLDFSHLEISEFHRISPSLL